MRRKQSGHAIGCPIPFREGQGATGSVRRGRLDVGLHVAIHPRRSPQDLDQCGVLPLNLTRRHIGGDCNRAAWAVRWVLIRTLALT